MKNLNSKGMTFIEVMLSLGLFVLSVTSYLSLYMAFQKSKSEANQSQIEKEILLQNILEIKGNKLSDLPEKNSCVTRIYSRDKKLVSEVKVPMLQNNCSKVTPSEGNIVIVWEVLGADKIDIEFTPSEGLKLPKYVDSLRQFNLTALSQVTGASTVIDETALSIFKRN